MSVVALLLVPSALANGGPVAWTQPTGVGGLVPQASVPVALVSETLTITLDDDLDHFRATAHYALDNPGAPAEVAFGVPVAWNGEFGSETPAADVHATIEITLAGVAQSCTFSGPPSTLPQTTEPTVQLAGWCVAHITVPAGKSSLDLTYDGELIYEDWETNKSIVPSFAQRTLLWPWSPAAGWSGRPDVTVEVRLGRYAPRTAVQGPPGSSRADGVVRWSLPAADLSSLPPLQLSLSPAAYKQHDVISSLNQHNPDNATATSTLAAQGKRRYDAAQAVDGRADTAWCEGVAGPGVGESLTLRWQERAGEPNWREECTIQGLAIVPGYARSAATFIENGRVTAVDIAACDAPTRAVRVEVPAASRHDASGVLLDTEPLHELFHKNRGGNCFKVTVAGTSPGSKYADTCISELRIAENCG